MDNTVEHPASVAAPAPWHLWVVGGAGALWNGFGAYDYLMTHLQPETYLRSMGITDEQMAYFDAMPAWMTAVWAIGVWGAVLATVFLLLRRRLACHLFVVSLAAMLVSLVYQYALSNVAEIMGAQAAVMSAVVTAGCVFFAAYAWAMAKRGVLR